MKDKLQDDSWGMLLRNEFYKTKTHSGSQSRGWYFQFSIIVVYGTAS